MITVLAIPDTIHANTELQNDFSTKVVTINVLLFKKLREIIFFLWDNHFMSHFEGHFEGAKTFLTP